MVRAAEEAASTLASSIHPEQCIKVLCPIVQTADYPINLAAFYTFLQNRNYVGHFLPKSKSRKEMGTANLVQLLILLPEDFFFFF